LGSIAWEALSAARVSLTAAREEVLEVLAAEPLPTETGTAERPLLGKAVHLLGFEDDALPAEYAACVRESLRASGRRPGSTAFGAMVIAFAPERDPLRMYEVGVACGEGRPVVVLHLPGERSELEGAFSLEVNDSMPRQLDALLRFAQ